MIIEKLTHLTIENQVGLIGEVDETEECRMTLILNYLTERNLPQDKTSAKRVKLKAPQYVIRDGKLYKHSYLQPPLKCVRPT